MDVVQLTADGDTTTDPTRLPDAAVHEPGRFNCNAYLVCGERPALVDAGQVDGVEQLYAGHGDPFHGDVRVVVETALERAEREDPKYPDR